LSATVATLVWRLGSASLLFRAPPLSAQPISHLASSAVIVKGMVEGKKSGQIARANRMTYAQLRWLTLNLAADLLEHLGEDILDESVKAPSWKGNLRVKSERVAWPG